MQYFKLQQYHVISATDFLNYFITVSEAHCVSNKYYGNKESGNSLSEHYAKYMITFKVPMQCSKDSHCLTESTLCPRVLCEHCYKIYAYGLFDVINTHNDK